MESFEDKVALISGGSRGVGFALARRLTRAGARVVITARGKERLEKSAEILRKEGAEVETVAGDIGDLNAAEKMVSAAIEHYERLDLLVNNAGVSMRGDFSDLSAEVCSRVIATNLVGSVNLSRIALKHIIQARGQIVFVSSIAGLFGLPGASVYCATKKALTGLCESLRLELLPKGVNVGVVYLGFTEHDPEKRILAANGELVLPDRPAHHTQDQAAARIMKMLAGREKQLIMTPIGNLGWLAYRLSPGLVEKVVLWAKATRFSLFRKFS